MSDWEEFYAANREDIERRFGPVGERSRQATKMSNIALSEALYKMILKGDLDDIIIAEAAERLSVAKELTTDKLGVN